MNDESFDFIDLLEDVKSDYLENLPAQITEAKQLIQSLAKSPKDQSLRKSVHRKIHSLKGSSGSCNLQLVSNLFRKFENYLLDYFETHQTDFNTKTPLEFLQLMEDYTKNYSEQEDRQNELNKKINQLLFFAQNKPESFDQEQVKEILGVNFSKFEKKNIKQIVERHPYHITWVNNEVEVFAHVLNHEYSHIILPRYLTKLDGLEFSKALQQLSIFPTETKIILILSEDMVEDMAVDEERHVHYLKKDGNFSKNLSHHFNINLAFKVKIHSFA